MQCRGLAHGLRLGLGSEALTSILDGTPESQSEIFKLLGMGCQK